MKKLLHTSVALLPALAASAAAAHPGHGIGPLGHDLQHQLWILGALVVVGATCLFIQSRNSDKK